MLPCVKTQFPIGSILTDMITFQMSAIYFSEWLQEEMNKRNLTQADLVRLSGLTSAAISRIMTGSRGAGPEACLAIARALDLPEEEVFRRAGLLSAKNEDPPTLGEWIHLYVSSSPEARKQMLELAQFLSKQSKKK